MYSRPALADLIARVRTDVLSRLNQDDVLRRADAEVYARVIGGVANGLYGYIDWLANQIIYDTADEDTLRRYCVMWGVPLGDATYAVGPTTAQVLQPTTITTGSILAAADGQQYQVTADVMVAPGSISLPLRAVAAGAAGNRTAGQQLTFISPVSGVQAQTTCGDLIGGTDAATVDDLRAALLSRIQQPPQGGAATDYVAWAKSVPGVTRAWVCPGELGPGTVVVRFVCDNASGGLIPSAAMVSTVQAAIDAVRPVTAQVTVLAPIAAPTNYQIQGLVPATPAVQAAIVAELQDLHRREAVPGGTLLLSHLRAAISAAAGEQDAILVTPSANVTVGTGVISTMGSVTWL